MAASADGGGGAPKAPKPARRTAGRPSSKRRRRAGSVNDERADARAVTRASATAGPAAAAIAGRASTASSGRSVHSAVAAAMQAIGSGDCSKGLIHWECGFPRDVRLLGGGRAGPSAAVTLRRCRIPRSIPWRWRPWSNRLPLARDVPRAGRLRTTALRPCLPPV